MNSPTTAYLHIPFCGHHCGYCDFAVTAGRDQLIPDYLNALHAELRRGAPRPVRTLFIGGGTPTYLSAEALEQLMAMIRECLPPVQDTYAEFTLESTPESITPEKCAVLAAAGVTRLSIGVQSFQPVLLAALDRQHGVEQIPQAVAAVRNAGFDLSFDLIFGAPGQTLSHWQADLQLAIDFQPEHLSTYGLTYEKGTPLWKARERGQLLMVPEEEELAMYEAAMDNLRAAGYEHYEVSNFAKPGHRCQHNECYWANAGYFGFGVGAARYESGVRSLNVRDTQLYICRVLAGQDPTFQTEELPPQERAYETIAVQLRRAAGIHRPSFIAQTGFTLDRCVGTSLPHLTELGLLTDDGTTVALTRRGFCLADGVIADLFKAALLTHE
ncbi:MAG: radical SAM family heme chaperone HemW [Gemmataceae bacterium]